MLFIFLYSLVQLSLLIRYRRNKTTEVGDKPGEREWPAVLVQLPVFNEYYVVERLIDSAANLDYPSKKLFIQVLDDSTDESFELAARVIDKWKSKGINIEHIKRPERIGYKAGALDYGFSISNQPFIAVFDADFIPKKFFLKKTLPCFSDPQIGMVQTRWEHLNRNYSLLTRVQAFALDAHFTVEQRGRNLGQHFINFNGTAGVWRRECISDAGGWSDDTLTEDFDLSYRAQLKDWKFRFLEEVGSPAELPAEMSALKNQQYRWNKGAAECARKHIRRVMTRKKIPIATRIHALFHLFNSSIFIWIVLCAILSLPLIQLKLAHPEFKYVFLLGGVLIFSFFILSVFYYTSFRKVDVKSKSIDFLWLYPAFLSISMGMSLHNTRAVLLGYSGKRTAFIRTPKWNLIGRTGSWNNKKYISKKIHFITWFEGLLALYFIFALVYGLKMGEYGFIPLHLMLVFGFTTVFVLSLKQAARS
jgi:cellulose synthase/poly-beta-1,6-N-acetylglucosamine synthase-like glycosyltransferase